MKFSWKIFISTFFVVLLSLSIGGTMIISAAFTNGLASEISRTQKEVRTMVMEIAALLQNYQRPAHVPDEAALKEVLDILRENWGKEGKQFQVLGPDGEILAGEGILQIRLKEEEQDRNKDLLSENGRDDISEQRQFTYMIWNEGESYYIQAQTILQLEGRPLRLLSQAEVTRVFRERAEQRAAFSRIMLLVGGFSAVLNAGLAIWLTRPVRNLTQMAQRLSRGDLRARVELPVSKKGAKEDEIGQLGRHFNQMADSLGRQMEELKEGARRQEDFVGSFTHEIKTPLTAIIGYADLLRAHELNEEEHFEAANYIYQEGKRLENLSMKLLELLIERRQKLVKYPVTLSALVEAALETARPALERRRINVIREVSADIIQADADLMKTVLLNLLDNAQKAVELGGTIRIRSEKTDGITELTLWDNGRGIPPQELERITEAFYMVNKSRARKEGGAGLGLSICARIMELHRGGIRFESGEGKGTKVILSFPAEKKHICRPNAEEKV